MRYNPWDILSQSSPAIDILVCLYGRSYNIGRRKPINFFAAPFVVVLTVLAAVVSFLFCMATAVFVVACVVLTLLAVALFISGQTLGGIVFLVLAFLISPYGIPAIAEWLVDKLHNLNFALRGFITG